ncbi:alanine racemase [Desulfovibrio sp. Huiquan2017]|uniref:alanine racemase n=1 Tax=Desulfovibrio sp. Huiquan2017 TaxID=2816861 RepID=UPI001A9398EA|nr:alanine racemase [Desulfovibrio sp. Huiquan2017]
MIDYNKLRVRIRLDNLRHNYRLFTQIHDNVIPVIKSDAYGHGLVEVASALEKDGAETFAVGFVHEAVKLRRSGCAKRILALLGPISDEDIQSLWEHRILTPISHFAQLKRVLAAAERNGPLNIGLKFDTGMRRLGFLPEETDEVAALLKGGPVTPVMATSHLARADEPGRETDVALQARRFQAALDGLARAGFKVEANLANSAGGLVHGDCRMDSMRLGIGLYGCDPLEGAGEERLPGRLRTAMSVSAPVMQVHPLKKGESISYGWTFTAERDSMVAIVGVGYADNYSRALSNRGEMVLHGRRVPIRGRVCMQMTAVDVTELMGEGTEVLPGDEAWLLGGPGERPVTPEDLAEWGGTITYEAFCLLGQNPREYV